MATTDFDAREPNDASGRALDACRREIRALHQFFEGWLRGTRPDTDASFRRLHRALAPAFRLISPAGDWRRRGDVLRGLRSAHGSRPGLTIDIRNVRVRRNGQQVVAATYEEWQRSESTEDGRLSTVVFARRPEAPTGLRWCHVHETWLQAPGEKQSG